MDSYRPITAPSELILINIKIIFVRFAIVAIFPIHKEETEVL